MNNLYNFTGLTVLLIALIFSAVPVHSADFTDVSQLHLIPQPKEITGEKGYFNVIGASILLKGGKSEANAFSVNLLNENWKLKAISPPKSGKFLRPIIIGFLKDVDVPDKKLVSDKIGNEGYILKVTPEKVIIAANTETGIFYGCQTLKLLLRADCIKSSQNSASGKNVVSIPCLSIVDWPSIGIRGISWDVSRGPIPTMKQAKFMFEMMSEFKINMVSFYIEHTILTKKHPEFAPKDSFTTAELKELSEYAAKYHIDLVPGYQSFGHFRNQLSLDVYKPLAETDQLWSLAPANEGTYKLLGDIYSEMIPSFKSKFFHANCDETIDLGQGQSKEMAAKLGPGGLYAYHINRLHDLVKPYGLRLMIWADIIGNHPENMKDIPDDVIMMCWNYGVTEKNADDWLLYYVDRKGKKDLFVCPGIQNWGRIYPDYNQGRINMKSLIRAGIKYKVMGVQNTIWHDSGETLDNSNWYGIIYGAAMSWGNVDMDDTDFDRRYCGAVFGAADTSIAKANQILTDSADSDGQFWWPLDNPGIQTQYSLVKNLDDYEGTLKRAIDLLKYSNPSVEKYAIGLKYMEFGARRYIFTVHRKKALLASKAALDKKDLEGAKKPISDLIEELKILKSEYGDLWLMENRPDYLSNILQRYDNLIAAYENYMNKLSL